MTSESIRGLYIYVGVRVSQNITFIALKTCVSLLYASKDCRRIGYIFRDGDDFGQSEPNTDRVISSYQLCDALTHV